MGWIASRDTANQVRLTFDTVDEAIAFAEKQGFDYDVIQPKEKVNKKKSYADNFRYVMLIIYGHILYKYIHELLTFCFNLLALLFVCI